MAGLFVPEVARKVVGAVEEAAGECGQAAEIG
jgi:hypothetical protein